MSGIFPNTGDGGLPPNAADTSNPSHAYDPVTDPVSTAALYYGNGCDVRLRPEVVNSIISEIEATADSADLAYDPGRLINLQLATRYLIQRGLPRAVLLGGPVNAYTGQLDPPATAYNNFMTLSIVPNITNTGATTFNLNGRGNVPVVRQNGLPLGGGELIAGIPTEAIYYNGKFYLIASRAGGVYDVIRQPAFFAHITNYLAPGVFPFYAGPYTVDYSDMGDAQFNVNNGNLTIGPNTKGIWAFFVTGIPYDTMTNKHNIACYSTWAQGPGNIAAANTADVDNGGGFSTHVALAFETYTVAGTLLQFLHCLQHMQYVSIFMGGVRVAGG
jgi:hypothetical protein